RPRPARSPPPPKPRQRHARSAPPPRIRPRPGRSREVRSPDSPATALVVAGSEAVGRTSRAVAGALPWWWNGSGTPLESASKPSNLCAILVRMADDRMADIFAAVRLGSDDPAAARKALGALWDELDPVAAPLQRCVVAHHLAVLQDDDHRALAWDQRALACIFTPGVALDEGMRCFLPSLYLNLADSHRRVGDFDAARMQLAIARGHLRIL